MPIAWNRINTLLLVLVLLVLAGALAKGVFGGPLDPPAPPASTMKTPEQVEPRTAISQPASAAGFPIAITQPGSYYLAGNITGVAGANGINVNAHDVTIDLNGFALNGVPSSGSGIFSSGWNTTVENGGISSWGVYGVQMMAPNSHILRVEVRSNGNTGIRSFGGSIDDSTITQNDGAGVIMTATGVVRGNQVASNAGDGIDVSLAGYAGAVLVEHNDVASNTGVGISVQDSRATVRDNMVALNTGGEILVSSTMSRVEGNAVTGDTAITIPFGIRVTNYNNFIARNTASHHVDNFDIAGGPAAARRRSSPRRAPGQTSATDAAARRLPPCARRGPVAAEMLRPAAR